MSQTSLTGSDLLLRLLGVLLLAAALGFAATKAEDRTLESLLPMWAPPPSDFIDLKGQLLHLRDQGPAGDPLPIVLIHGTSASLHTWEGWVAELSKTRRVISFDLPGFGLTGPAMSGDYSIEAYSAFVSQLLAHLQVQRAVLAGNSLGGEVAWTVAADRPDLAAGLILVDASGYNFKPDAVPLGFYLARLPGVSWLSQYLLPRQLVASSVRSVYGDPARASPELIDRYFELTLRAGNRAALTQRLVQMQFGNQVDRLKQLRLPTLILWGELDRLIPPVNGEAFARDIAGSQLVTLPGLGHVPHEEDPAASLVPVQAFLTTLKP
ncbi:alpha/beta fold hydrolase [Roseateles sp.]|uniref:alpha/beta fold hydrolase n=1 Tax=Roseateles sp. TaxID=1971397 RepID=UPI003BA5DAD3